LKFLYKTTLIYKKDNENQDANIARKRLKPEISVELRGNGGGHMVAGLSPLFDLEITI
jgi:hypothetical protein